MKRHTFLIFFGVLIILLPYAGLSGDMRSVVTQILGVLVIIFALSLIKRKKKDIITIERTNIPEVND